VSASRDALRRLDQLLTIGLRLAQNAPTGRVALAQLAAGLDPAWIPSPAGDAVMAQLADAAEAARSPLSLKEVERVLRGAWGGNPTDELDDLDGDPVAVTPGAQVHRGVREGAPVAVKVLRPGLAAGVRQDLTVLEALAGPLGSAFPALDVAGVIREIRERVLEELDLESEATLQRRFHRALRRHPFLSVPAPLSDLCHESVLVSEWVDGVPLDHASDPDEAAARYAVFVLGAARWGVAYADPHGDNVRVLADGSLAIVDFGACREIDPERLAATTDVLAALAAGDDEGFAASLDRLGWLPAEHAPAAFELARTILGELVTGGPVRLDRDAVIAARDRMIAHAGPLGALVPHGRLAPEDLWPARGVAQLVGTLARVGAQSDWTAVALGALRDGWD
jgi:predicted unusual protein kinase regulating ubiquinone biosynthesis (AarF/ABC1/UbiB family)